MTPSPPAELVRVFQPERFDVAAGAFVGLDFYATPEAIARDPKARVREGTDLLVDPALVSDGIFRTDPPPRP